MENKIIKKVRKAIISLLCFLMCTEMVTAPVKAKSAEETASFYSGVNTEEKDVVMEKEECLEIGTRHFLMKDGTTLALGYPTMCAEYNEETGRYEKVDNTITETEGKVCTPYNKRNPFEADELGYRVNIEDTEIQVSLRDRKEVKPHIESMKEDGIFANKAVSDVVVYEEIRKDTDINIQVTIEEIKENIILKSAEAEREFEYEVTAEGIVLLSNEKEKRIEIIKGDKTIGYIEAPYAIDAEGRISFDITTEVTDENHYRLKVNDEYLDKATYPVTIDPTIVKKLDIRTVYTTTAISSRPNSKEMYSYGGMYVGRDSSEYEKMRGFMKFTLPTLKESDTVVMATIGANHLLFSQSGVNLVKVKKLTKNISISSITWNNTNGYFGDITDYARTTMSTKGNWFKFDITSIVQGWYEHGNNYGLLFQSNNESDTYRWSSFVTSHFPNLNSRYPFATVSYISKAGIEEYFSYEKMNTISMGSVYAGHFNGNLVYLVDEFKENGNGLVNSISHVYNQCFRDRQLTGTMKFGKGFTLNVSLRATKDGDNYKVSDADGTEHYFIKNNTTGKYEKEFDSDTVLTVNTSTVVVKEGIYEYTYNRNDGFIRSISDTLNNKTQSFVYDADCRLTEVVSEDNRAVQLNYDTEGYLTAIRYNISDDGYKEISYSYDSNGNLSEIHKADGNTISFSYDSHGSMTSVSNINEGRVEIGYIENSPYRVRSFKRYGKDNGEGEEVHFSYKQGETEITDAEGYTLKYMFDNYGHTVCTTDNYGNGVYEGYANSSDNNHNTLNYSSALQYPVVNLMKSTYTLSSASYSNGTLIINGGSASQSFTLQGDTEYTLSFDSDDDTVVTINGQQYECTGRSHYSISFDTEETGNTTVEFSSEDNAQIGNIYIEKGSTETRHSLLKNGGFEDGSNGWTRVNLTANDTVTEFSGRKCFVINGNSGNKRSLKQTLAVSGNEGDSFVVSGYSRNNYHVAIESLNQSTSESTNRRKRSYGIRVTFHNGTATSVREYDFTSASGSWQYLSAEVKAPCDYQSVDVEAVYEYQCGIAYFDDICLFKEGFGSRYEHDNSGRVTKVVEKDGRISEYSYSDVTVVKADGTSETVKKTGSVTYRENEADSQPIVIQYSYDSKGNITEEVYTDTSIAETDQSRVIATEYHYENNKLVYTSINGTKRYESGKIEYTDSLPSSYTDENGNVTQFGYDGAGRLVTLTDPRGNETEYIYNSNDGIEGIRSDESEVCYLYSAIGQIETIEHSNDEDGTTVYSFEYDEFGNLINVSVSSGNILSEYEYEGNNGKLYSLTNGNGEEISYRYDELSRVKEIWYGDNLRYSFGYGSDGRIGRFIDHENNETVRYSYSLSGNITDEYRSSGILLHNEYDEKSRVTSSGYERGNESSYTDITYNPHDEAESLTYHTGNLSESSVSYTRDYFRRIARTEYSSSGNTVLTSEYTFREINDEEADDTKVTLMLENYTNEYGSSNEVYSYLYDENGNITEISYDDGDSSYQIQYQYDALNQLTEVYDVGSGKRIRYSYDDGGNITSKRETVNGTETVKVYVYGNDDWKDQLTAYNGNTITYDAMGNPIQYYDGKVFGWSYGRLSGYTDSNDNTVEYSYNADGIRVGKSINGTEINYVVSGSTILEEYSDNYSIKYEYDINGKPVSFVYNNNRYIYLSNGLSDVTGILDINGNLVAKYEYDGYGSCRVVNYTQQNIGDINPLRFKGYYFDSESGLYYLNARYYDCNVGRFISADEIEYLGVDGTVIGYNLYSYCDNNPVSRNDPKGLTFGYIIASGLINTFIGCVTALITGQEYSMWDLTYDFCMGCVGTFSYDSIIYYPIISFFSTCIYTAVNGKSKNESLVLATSSSLTSLFAPSSVMQYYGISLGEKVYVALAESIIDLGATSIDNVVNYFADSKNNSRNSSTISTVESINSNIRNYYKRKTDRLLNERLLLDIMEG